MDCKEAKNKTVCTCTYEPCSRKGICCECIAYHNRNNELPACVFPPEVERGYDRSVRKFVQVMSKKM